MEITRSLDTLLTIEEVVATNLESEATEHLQRGWKLLCVARHRDGDHECAVYSLGRPSDVFA